MADLTEVNDEEVFTIILGLYNAFFLSVDEKLT